MTTTITGAATDTLRVVRDPAAISQLATGPVYLTASLLAFATPEVAWQGLADLHARAIGEVAVGSMAEQLTQEEAFSYYSNGLSAVLSQLAVVDGPTADRMLDSLNDHADFQGNLNGLESPFFSAYLSAGRDGSISDTMDRASDIFNDVGLPGRLGGGAQSSPILDAAGRMLGFPTQQDLGGLAGTAADRLQQMLGDFTRPDAAGGSGPGSSQDAGEFAGSVIVGAIGLVTAALFSGPLGAAELIVGAVAFFADLFGGSSDKVHEQAQPAREASGGTTIVVENHVTVTVNVMGEGNTVTVGPTGTVTTTPAPTNAPAPAPAGPPATPKCTPEKCPVGDDSSVADFSLPFWRNDALMAPALCASGPGLDSLLTVSGDMVRILDLPTVDQTAQIDDAGLLTVALGTGGRLTRGGGGQLDQSVGQLLRRAAAVRAMRAAGVDPSTPIQDALRMLGERRRSR